MSNYYNILQEWQGWSWNDQHLIQSTEMFYNQNIHVTTLCRGDSSRQETFEGFEKLNQFVLDTCSVILMFNLSGTSVSKSWNQLKSNFQMALLILSNQGFYLFRLFWNCFFCWGGGVANLSISITCFKIYCFLSFHFHIL